MALSLMSSAYAFSPISARAPVIRMQAAVDEEPPPLIKTMMVGDKTLAGDMNFDPLQIADTPDKLAWFREAEIRHARLAMLAALGWPVSEVTNSGGLLTAEGRAPALLNGGLGDVSSIYWAGVAALAIAAEAKSLDKQFGKKDDYLPGMLGFDPLGMDAEWSRNAEITNGRVAMMAISVYAYQEALTKAPIFPISLFTPFKNAAAPAAVAPAVVSEAAEWKIGPDGSLINILEEQARMQAESAAAAAAAAAEAVAPIADAAATAVAPIADAVAPIASAL